MLLRLAKLVETDAVLAVVKEVLTVVRVVVVACGQVLLVVTVVGVMSSDVLRVTAVAVIN